MLGGNVTKGAFRDPILSNGVHTFVRRCVLKLWGSRDGGRIERKRQLNALRSLATETNTERRRGEGGGGDNT